MSDSTERHQVSLEPGVWVKVRPEQVRLTERRTTTTNGKFLASLSAATTTAPNNTHVTIETVLEPVDGDPIIVDMSMVADMKLDAEQVQALRDHGWI